jgi:hypothetical protein
LRFIFDFLKKLKSDDSLFLLINGSGSVDEKITTCDFKRKQYLKVFARINYRVGYIYLFDS